MQKHRALFSMVRLFSILFFLCGWLLVSNAQIAKEWEIGYSVPLSLQTGKSTFIKMNFQSTHLRLDTFSQVWFGSNQSSSSRNFLANKNGGIDIFKNGALFSKNTFIRLPDTANSASTSRVSSLLIRNPLNDTIIHYFFGSNVSGPGFNLRNFNDSLGFLQQIGPRLLLDSMLGVGAGTYQSHITNHFSFKHCNGLDNWYVRWNLSKRRFYSHLITKNGVDTAPIISPVFSNLDIVLDILVSPDGKQVVLKGVDTLTTQYFDSLSMKMEYDSSFAILAMAHFDNSTGLVTSIHPFDSFKMHSHYHKNNYLREVLGASLAFSPDQRFLYHIENGHRYIRSGGNYTNTHGTDSSELFQFELINGSYAGPRLIASFYNQRTRFHDMARGPDNKIHILIGNASSGGYFSFSGCKLLTMHAPNARGINCLIGAVPKDTLPLDVSYFPRLSPDQIAEAYFFHTKACAGDTTFLWVADSTCLDSIQWNFGDSGSGSLNFATGFKVPHVYNQLGTYPIQLIRFNNGTLKDTLYKSITVEGFDTVRLAADTILCRGDSIGLVTNLTHDYKFLWQDGSTDSLLVTLDSGWHWVKAFNECILTEDSLYVQDIRSPDTSMLGKDTALCATSFPLNATWPLASYRWNTLDTTASISATASGVYRVTATNICGVGADTIRVNLHPIPQPNIPDTSVCVGKTIRLSAPFDFTTHIWSNWTSSNYILINSPGKYWVRTSNLCGVFSDTFLVASKANPKVELGFSDTLICANQPLVLNAYDSNATSYFWRHSGSSDSAVSVAASGLYHVAVSNECGLVIDSVLVRAIQSPSVSLGNDTAICASDSIQLLVLGSHDSATYLWNSTVVGSSAFMAKDVGIYSVLVTNQCGVGVDSVLVSELPKPVIPFSSD
ncbi:MAG: hypothetical protein KDC83_03565, partial [Flavobacteriales bacterium]|nr:hypothetical protein [Flavobacteriales bacterium]